MTVGTTWLLRNATTTNNVGHSYTLNTIPIVDEESYGNSRYYNSFNLSTWDETNSTTLQGVTADGMITKTDTVLVGSEPSNPP